MFRKLDLEADLVVSVNDDHFVVVGEGNCLIVNFRDLKALERVMKTVGDLEPRSDAPKPQGGPLKKLNDLNQQILDLGLKLDIRVGNKTYVEFGSGNSAKIKPAAIFGKIGSFFSRG